MQIAEAAFFESTDGTGVNVLSPGDSILAVHFAPDSSYPGGEAPAFAIDGTLDKYLNFGADNSGFIVTPSSGADAVRSFRITTANDSPERDPAMWELYGTDDPITSADNSQGLAENWTLIDSGSVALPDDRDTPGSWVVVDNDTSFSSYRMVFTDLKDASQPIRCRLLRFSSTICRFLNHRHASCAVSPYSARPDSFAEGIRTLRFAQCEETQSKWTPVANCSRGFALPNGNLWCE